jgi:hypothetical protein
MFDSIKKAVSGVVDKARHPGRQVPGAYAPRPKPAHPDSSDPRGLHPDHEFGMTWAKSDAFDRQSAKIKEAYVADRDKKKAEKAVWDNHPDNPDSEANRAKVVKNTPRMPQPWDKYEQRPNDENF